MSIQNLLKKLSEKMTDSEIGREIGAPQSTINRLRNGKHKSTSFERGMAITALAEKILKAPENAPD